MNYDGEVEFLDEKKQRRRNHGVDAMRYILALSVVLLHSLPRPSSSAPLWSAPIAIACRAAVPFFFIASGYFFPQRTKPSLHAIVKPLRRLLPIFIFWMMVYCAYFQVFLPGEWHWHIGDLLSGGAAFHLWFLPALAIALILVGTCLPVLGPKITGLLCVLLWIFSLARGAYYDVLHLPISSGRGGALAAPIYVYAGAMISRHSLSLPWRRAAVLAGLFYAVLVVEEGGGAYLTGKGFLISHDFLFATLPFGIFTFLMAKDLPDVPGIENVAKLGAVSLGVYTSHVLFLWPLSGAIGNASIVSVLIVAVAVSIASTLLSMLLKQLKYVGNFVE